MEDYRVGFTKMFNERNNIEQSKFYIGSVVQTSPLKISVQDGKAYFTKDDNLVVCDTLNSKTLNINDKILCFPLDSISFIAFDKV